MRSVGGALPMKVVVYVQASWESALVSRRKRSSSSCHSSMMNSNLSVERGIKKQWERHTKQELSGMGVAFATEDLLVMIPVVIFMQIGLINPSQRCL